MGALHTIFIMYAPIVAICFLCAVLIKDEGVAEKDAKPAETKPAGDEEKVANS